MRHEKNLLYNADSSAKVPEPSVAAAMFAIAGLGLMKTRRRGQAIR